MRPGSRNGLRLRPDLVVTALLLASGGSAGLRLLRPRRRTLTTRRKCRVPGPGGCRRHSRKGSREPKIELDVVLNPGQSTGRPGPAGRPAAR